MVASFALIRRHAPRALSVLALSLTLGGVAVADEAADKALEEKILKVIREHPKEIMEAVVGYQRSQAEQRMKSAETRLAEQVAQLKSGELLADSPCAARPTANWC